jgi:hypothetical protein
LHNRQVSFHSINGLYYQVIGTYYIAL